MGSFSRLLRFLLWVLVLSWSLALLRRALIWVLRGPRPSDGGSNRAETPVGAPATITERRLVRDPVCGVYVAEVLAVPLHEAGEVVHFCSTACRDRYTESTKKFTANAS